MQMDMGLERNRATEVGQHLLRAKKLPNAALKIERVPLRGRHWLKRLFDISFALTLLVLFAPLFFLVGLAIKVADPGPALYWSRRVGRSNRIFYMPKFRSMKMNTLQVATHLLENPEQYLISIGHFIRKSSLDELPQLISIIRGHMSFVGPRPALYNQDDLIEERTIRGLHELTPGVTGWAQINGRDEISIKEKVQLETDYAHNKSLFFDLKIIFLTAWQMIRPKGVSH